MGLATGLVKLADRTDRVIAEKEAVEGNLALAMPAVNAGPGAIKMKKDLEKHLEKTKGQVPDPLGTDRGKLATALAGNPSAKTLANWYGKLWPDRVNQPSLNPDEEFFKELQKARPAWNLRDPDTRLAAYYVASGQDTREKGYSWRLALTVVDVLAEFGAENTALFVRDTKLQAVVGAVLKNFGEPDLAKIASLDALLRHALAASLNGALDATGAIEGDNEWLDAVFGALSDARKESGDGDNYVLGLLRGKGFPLLLGNVVDAAADRIGAEGSDGFRKVAGDVLKTAAPLVEGSTAFRGFFRDHWGDLLRAGLGSVEKYGPSMLADSDPLVQKTLVAMVGRLEQTKGTNFFTSETLFGVADAAIGVVAANPALITNGLDEPWLKELIDTSVGVLSKKGLRDAYSKDGLQSLVQGALARFAAHPELIVRQPGLARTLVEGVLTNVKPAGMAGKRELAEAAVSGALRALSENPDLLDFNYAEIVASFSGKLAKLVAADGPLTSIQARQLLTAAEQALVENPAIFKDAGAEICAAIVTAVLDASKSDPTKLLAGRMVVDVAQGLLTQFARRGSHKLEESDSLNKLAKTVTEVLTTGLKSASERIGSGLARSDVTNLLIELFGGWLITDINPADAAFDDFVKKQVESAAA
jgi:hypothetical protein